MREVDTGPDASGPKLSVGATPTASEEMMKRGIQAEVIPLPDGRKLHVRKPGVLAQFHLIEALGAELGINQAYVQMVMPLTYLGLIEDGDGSRPVSFQNKLQIEGLISELGEHGFDALLSWYAVNVLAPMGDQIEAVKKAAQEKALLKNG